MSAHDHHELPAAETRDAGSQALAEALRSSFAIVKIAMGLLVRFVLQRHAKSLVWHRYLGST